MRLRSRPLHSRIFIYRVYIYALYAFWLMTIPVKKLWGAVCTPAFVEKLHQKEPALSGKIEHLSQKWLFRAQFLLLVWFMGILLASFWVPSTVFEAPASALPSDLDVASPAQNVPQEQAETKFSANKAGFLVFGPGIELPLGLYRFQMFYTFKADTPTSTASFWDIRSDSSWLWERSNVFLSKDQIQTVDILSCAIKPIQNLEFRAYFGRDGRLAVHRLIIQRFGPRLDIFRSKKAQNILSFILALILIDGAASLWGQRRTKKKLAKKKRHG
ncbi:MAG: hypothetical protein AB7E52_01325 [Bdellovibrionales bacterium]